MTLTSSTSCQDLTRYGNSNRSSNDVAAEDCEDLRSKRDVDDAVGDGGDAVVDEDVESPDSGNNVVVVVVVDDAATFAATFDDENCVNCDCDFVVVVVVDDDDNGFVVDNDCEPRGRCGTAIEREAAAAAAVAVC